MKWMNRAFAMSVVALSACTAMKRWQAEDTENVLVAAGFTVQSAIQPGEVEKLNKLTPPLKVVRRSLNGMPVYTYADPYSCKCVYVGTEEEYGEYKRLALEKQIATEEMAAAQMTEESTETGWWWWQ